MRTSHRECAPPWAFTQHTSRMLHLHAFTSSQVTRAFELMDEAKVRHHSMQDDFEGESPGLTPSRSHKVLADDDPTPLTGNKSAHRVLVKMQGRSRSGIQQCSSGEVCFFLGGGLVLVGGAVQLIYGLMPQLLPTQLRAALDALFLGIDELPD